MAELFIFHNNLYGVEGSGGSDMEFYEDTGINLSGASDVRKGDGSEVNFPLEKTPKGSVKVEVAQVNIYSGYSYDSVNNRIVFDTAPDANVPIVFYYTVEV